MDIKKVCDGMIAALMESTCRELVDIDGGDTESVIEGENKATFNMHHHVDVKTGPGRHDICPVGIWTYKVTVEATYQSFDDESEPSKE